MSNRRAFLRVVPLLCMVVPIICCASTKDESAARRIAIDYSAAFAKRDIDAMYLMTHPAVKIRLGGREGYRRLLQRLWDAMDSDKVTYTERIGAPSDEFVDGATRMIGIPVVRNVSNGIMNAYSYVLFSYDSGASWYVFDLSCTDSRWIKALAPTWNGSPDVLGDADPGKNPTDATFDVEHFLAGSRK
jgi:hypothetical protein